MKMSDIAVKIVKRANKDFNHLYLLEMAEEFFRSSCFSLLGGLHPEIS